MFLSTPKLILLATISGFVFVLDNKCEQITKLKCHSKKINDMSLDKTNDMLATCSDDGNVVITNMYTRENTKHVYQRSVYSVALYPKYKEETVFAAGGLNRQLIINTPFWFSTKDTVIHGGEGPIYAIKWCDQLIAWANDLGVKVYDYGTRERVTFIGRSGPPPGAYRCHLCWKNSTTLIIGWANSVKIGVVKTRKSVNDNNVSKYIQIVAMFNTDFIISGIAPYEQDLIVLAYILNEDNTNENLPPEIRILTQANEEIISEALPIAGYDKYHANDYHLSYTTAIDNFKEIFYIIAPQDIVIAKPCDVDDHLLWLLGHKRYDEALSLAKDEENQLITNTVLDVGQQCLKAWFDHHEYQKVANHCPDILRKSIKHWESWVLAFSVHKQLPLISDYVPTLDPILSHEIYELILNHYLRTNHIKFSQLISKWPDNIYNKAAVISAVLSEIDQKEIIEEDKYESLSYESSLPSSSSTLKQQQQQQPEEEAEEAAAADNTIKCLYKALGDLYIKSRQYAKALHSYLKLGDSKLVFNLANKLDLSSSIKDEILALVLLDANQAIELFVKNRERIPIHKVINQLKSYPKLQHKYLDSLFIVDQLIARDYHDLQVELYAKYDANKLLKFLHNSNSYYQLEKALKICQDKQLYKEQVHILRRMGSTNQALHLIIEKLNDVKQAIQFIQQDKNNSLWPQVIKHSLNNPNFLIQLLDVIGDGYDYEHLNILMLIEQIPNHLLIPNLKDKIINILRDQTLQLQVRIGCNNILKRDCLDLQSKLIKKVKKLY